MALSPKTVAYQETSNNYLDIRQQIQGTQISSVKVFGTAPTGNGAYQGQFGIANPVPAITNFYVWSGTAWVQVASSDATSLPDTVVREDIDNNFTHPNQRIVDCPIAYLDEGAAAPTSAMIKGPGHFYVQQVDPIRVFMTVDGMDWVQLRTHDDTGDYVVRDQANDFTHNDQTINARPILSAIQHTVDPTVAGIVPERLGQIFVQLKEGTVDKRARMWIANPDGGMHWEEVVAPVATMVRTDKENDFAVVDQKLNGKQILSFVDGGDKTPGQSGLKPDYDGQAYIAVRTMVGSGDKSVGVWIANGNSWLPILEDSVASTLVRTDKPNYFTDVNQFIGIGDEARQITGARLKTGGLSPITDSLWRTNCIGEITVWHNTVATPNEYSVWVSVLKNPSTGTNAGEWQLLWSSVNGAGAYVAKTNVSNRFSPMQYISDGAQDHLITCAREGGFDAPKGRIVPMSSGEFYSQTLSGGAGHHMWMAAHAADTDGWKRIYTTEDTDIIRADEQNEFNNNEQFMRSSIAGKKDRIMGSRPAKVIGPNTITGPAYNAIEPTMFGEVVVCEEWDPLFPSDETKIKIRAYLAVGKGRKSWLMIGEDLKSRLELLGDDSNN